MLSRFSPPMATTGTSAAAQMSRSICPVTRSASALVPVGNTAPTPR